MSDHVKTRDDGKFSPKIIRQFDKFEDLKDFEFWCFKNIRRDWFKLICMDFMSIKEVNANGRDPSRLVVDDDFMRKFKESFEKNREDLLAMEKNNV